MLDSFIHARTADCLCPHEHGKRRALRNGEAVRRCGALHARGDLGNHPWQEAILRLANKSCPSKSDVYGEIPCGCEIALQFCFRNPQKERLSYATTTLEDDRRSTLKAVDDRAVTGRLNVVLKNFV